MNTPENLDLARIAEVVEYIRASFKSQPILDDVARQVRKPNRLYDLFINIERMTPSEYRNGGEQLSINYSLGGSPFGDIIVAATPKGICHMAFVDEPTVALCTLKEKFPKARYHQTMDDIQQNALSAFTQDRGLLNGIKLHLKGTAFQLKVWEILLQIPMGRLTTYGDIASKLNNPNASRAVGTAIGNNPIALLIPCHRVVRSSGELGGYHWGLTRKAAIISWEASPIHERVGGFVRHSF